MTAMMMKALAVSLSPLSSRLMVRNRMLRLKEGTVVLVVKLLHCLHPACQGQGVRGMLIVDVLCCAACQDQGESPLLVSLLSAIELVRSTASARSREQQAYWLLGSRIAPPAWSRLALVTLPHCTT